jgi:hypothetical protein
MPEDERKLHSEVLQTVNQRFLTTTAAITLFGVIAGLAVQQAPSGGLQTRRSSRSEQRRVAPSA